MQDWVFPLTVFFLGYIIWMLGLLFSQKNANVQVATIASATSIAGLLWLVQRDYIVLPALLFSFAGLSIILTYGFDISFQREKADGPLAKYIRQKGRSITELNPKGKVDVNGDVLAAMTEGIFVNKDVLVKVIRVTPDQVIVEKIDE